MTTFEEIYSAKLKIRQEESRLTDSAFSYDKEEFTNFVKIFYNDRVHNEEIGLVQLAKNLVAEVVKSPTMLLAFIFFSRYEGDGTFVNYYTPLSLNVISLTNISISKNAIQFLDEQMAIECLNGMT